MRTAVDSSILLDVFAGAEPYLEASQEALRQAIASASLLAGEVVWAELRPRFESDEAFISAMEILGVGFEASTREVALEAGKAWKKYREEGGRRYLIPDFLVGACQGGPLAHP